MTHSKQAAQLRQELGELRLDHAAQERRIAEHFERVERAALEATIIACKRICGKYFGYETRNAEYISREIDALSPADSR